MLKLLRKKNRTYDTLNMEHSQSTEYTIVHTGQNMLPPNPTRDNFTNTNKNGNPMLIRKNQQQNNNRPSIISGTGQVMYNIKHFDTPLHTNSPPLVIQWNCASPKKEKKQNNNYNQTHSSPRKLHNNKTFHTNRNHGNQNNRYHTNYAQNQQNRYNQPLSSQTAMNNNPSQQRYNRQNINNNNRNFPHSRAQPLQQSRSDNAPYNDILSNDNPRNDKIIREQEQTKENFISLMMNNLNTENRKKNHIEQQSWFYKKSRHIKQWRNRWTLIKYDEKSKNYILYTYKNKIKLNNPTETLIIDKSTQIKFEKDEESDAKSYGIYLLTIKTPQIPVPFSPRGNRQTAEILEFRTGIYEVGMDWLNAINTIIHLSQMNTLNMTTKPNYVNDNDLIFIIYAYLHYISYNYNQKVIIANNIISMIFHFTRYQRIEFKISPSYCLMHRVSAYNDNNHKIDLIELSTGNSMTLSKRLNNIRKNCGHYLVKNKLLPPYIQHQSRMNDSSNDKCDLLFRCGGNQISRQESNSCNECELIAFKPWLSYRQKIESAYYHLPQLPVNITSTTVIFNNNLLFVIGGIVGKTPRKIYLRVFMD